MPRLRFGPSAVCLLASLALIAGCTAGAAPSSSPVPEPIASIPPELAAAIATRTEFGLRADAEYVANVHAAGDSIEHELGILVTPVEAAELARRFGAETDLEALIAYGAEQVETFGGLYIDQASGGDVVLLFTEGLERHAAAASDLAPDGVTVRVERVRFTEAELVELLENLDFGGLAAEGHDMVGASLDTIDNIVELELKSDDPSIEQRLEALHGGRLDVVVHPKPGPWENRAAGDGWRLIGAGIGRNDAYTVRAATDAAEWAAMWEAIGLEQEIPEADFADEVVVSFGHGIGSSCPELRLDDVAIADDVVFSVASDPLAPRGCTADLVGAAVFVVALSRDSLPDAGFTLRLAERAVTGGGADFNEEIEVDLP